MSFPLLECKDIIKIFPAASNEETFATLRGISLKIHIGDFIIIQGPSGVGKTTFLDILYGVLPPSAGSIRIENIPLISMSLNELIKFRKNRISYLYQNPRSNIIRGLNILENVMLPMLFNSAISPSVIHQEAMTLLEKYDMASKSRENPTKLSGGEIQRVGLAIIEANNPKLYLLDEPTSQLDSLNAKKIIERLNSLCKKRKASVVMVTHKKDFINLATMTFRMNEGRLTILN